MPRLFRKSCSSTAAARESRSPLRAWSRRSWAERGLRRPPSSSAAWLLSASVDQLDGQSEPTGQFGGEGVDLVAALRPLAFDRQRVTEDELGDPETGDFHGRSGRSVPRPRGPPASTHLTPP